MNDEGIKKFILCIKFEESQLIFKFQNSNSSKLFKPGDKVKVVDDNQKGEVVRIEKGRVVVLTQSGFEDIFDPQELLPDVGMEVGAVPTEEEPEISPPKKVKKPEESREIDLHIGQLVDYTRNLSNYDMLQIQLKKVKEEMELAYAEKRKKLIFIHGHGSGKLKEELHKLLKTYKRIEFYDAKYRKYRLGATEVRFR